LRSRGGCERLAPMASESNGKVRRLGSSIRN
jgi:hypothetical protein